MPDPLQDILLQKELAKKSWANPANRPPRDTSALINRRNKTPNDARAMQRRSIENTLGVGQPRAFDGGLMKNIDGSLSVTTDPNEVLQHMIDFPGLYLDDIEELKTNDEDAADNADQDPEETLMRLLLQKVVQR